MIRVEETTFTDIIQNKRQVFQRLLTLSAAIRESADVEVEPDRAQWLNAAANEIEQFARQLQQQSDRRLSDDLQALMDQSPSLRSSPQLMGGLLFWQFLAKSVLEPAQAQQDQHQPTGLQGEPQAELKRPEATSSLDALDADKAAVDQTRQNKVA